MKRLLALTTALCAVAAGLGSVTAFADGVDDGLNEYPESFTREISFNNLEDYAVGVNKFAFLENNVILEYVGETLYGYEDGGITAKAVYYSDSGALCYGNDEGIFEHGTNEPVEIEVSAEKRFILGDYVYTESSAVYAIYTPADGEPGEPTLLEGFSNLKKFGDTAYAVKDNALCTLNGTESEKLAFTYLDYSDTKKILAADTLASVGTLSKDTPYFVELKDGAFMTEVDADKLDGTYFDVGDTVRVGKEVSAGTALLIADTGNISMIMICGETRNRCYIMRSADVISIERNAVVNKETEVAATVTVADGYIYTAPFICKSTQLAEIQAGNIVKISGEVTKTVNPELVRDFYKVEFVDDNGETVTGYVPFGYVSPYQYAEKPPVETPDHDYTEEDLIKPVVLIIVVIALVLIAAGYLIFVATGDKSKKPKKQ